MSKPSVQDVLAPSTADCRSLAAWKHKARLDAAQSRLSQARAIAERLRHDAQLHRFAMLTVFTLEDCLFELDQTYRLAMRLPLPDHL